MADYLTKFELDFGDGTGWRDYTAEAESHWFVTLEGSPYTYTEPGTYQLRGRVTYWDGEVVYAEPPWEYTIVVTAAQPES